MNSRRKWARALPLHVARVIEADDGIWSDHALEEADRLGLVWTDVIEVSRTPESIKKERDQEAIGGYKYALTGRDTRGRRLYMAGKVVSFEQDAYWMVITIRKAD